jgi:YD repeat-containing protein
MKMKTIRMPRQFLAWLILSLVTVSCDIFKRDEPAPEKVCKLLYDGGGAITYEYDSKDQLTQSTDGRGITKYNYDKNGYLTEIVMAGNITYKYQYTNGLLSKMTYPQGSKNQEINYEYDGQKKLTKSILTYRDGTETRNYNNGKEISFIRNESGKITQPFQYENGKVIRITQEDRSYVIYDFDSKGRKIRTTSYDNAGRSTSYLEYLYQDGIFPQNANPNHYFKGFPDEIKDLQPDGVLRSWSAYTKQSSGTFRKTSESNYTYVLNQKGYVIAQTFTHSTPNTVGGWNVQSSSKTTYAYINCDE